MQKEGDVLRELLLKLKVKAKREPALMSVYEEGMTIADRLFNSSPSQFSESEKLQEWKWEADEFIDAIDKKSNAEVSP
mgnify:CR=1 FL=1